MAPAPAGLNWGRIMWGDVLVGTVMRDCAIAPGTLCFVYVLFLMIKNDVDVSQCINVL